MTSTPHDALFKAAFERPEHVAEVFRGFLPLALASQIDWNALCAEPGSFIDPELNSRHTDLLFSTRLCDSPAYVYLLLEHQSSNDPDMPLRMLRYLTRIWERHRRQYAGYLPPIIPALVSHASEGWTAPRSFHELFDPSIRAIPELTRHLPNFVFLVADLIGMDDDDLQGRPLAPFPKLVFWLLRDARNTRRLLEALEGWAPTMRELLGSPGGLDAVEQLLRYVALVAGEVRFVDLRAKLEQQLPEARGVIMTIAEELREEGRRKGLQEGHARGLRKALSKQFTLKFGVPSPVTAARIATADVEELERYIERILTADTLEMVFAST